MNLNILIADDQELNRMLLSKVVAQLGHRFILAATGREAVEKFGEHRPDLVLMDVMMPEMNGLDAMAMIKAMGQDRHVPILLLSAMSEEEDILHGLKAGADDYITKPLQIDILNAKLNNFERSILAQRQLAEQHEELRRYHFAMEDEKRIASHLIQSLIDTEGLRAPGVDWWLKPADTFSGDILAAAYTPVGALHIMLADGTGHGLAAALSTLPLPDIFYAMTGHGYPIGSIALELNRQISRLLPIDRFFAATLVAFDTNEEVVEVWNGGNPAALLIDPGGAVIHGFDSRHLPLGISRTEDFSPETERMPYPQGAQLMLMSDGLLDASNSTSSAYGLERLRNLIAGTSSAQRLDAIKQDVLEHLDGKTARDDISAFIISTGLLGNAASPQGEAVADASCPSGGETWRFQLALNGVQLRQMGQEVVPFMMYALERLHDMKSHRSALYLTLSELFNNSLDHGLLGLDSRLKNAADGFEVYLGERSKRLSALGNEAFIEFEIEMTDQPAINIVVCDSGAGFDHDRVMRQVAETGEYHGRGIALVRSLVSKLEYPGAGNEARVNISLNKYKENWHNGAYLYKKTRKSFT